MQESERRLAAIMFTDIVGYTALAQKDERLALSLLEKQRELVPPVFSRHEGRVVKSLGDGFLVEFPSALEAVECAAEIQKILADFNRDATDKLTVRIGVHVGDVVHTGQDVLGDAVNIASRIVPLAEGGGICISEQVFSQVRNKVPYQMERLEPHTLKNVQYPVETYRLMLPSRDAGSESAGPRNRVAVLPLANISPDPKDGYFADGMTEELITVLSQVRGLRVIARTSIDRYKTRDRGVAQIGRELGVGSMIEGSVRVAGNRLRVTVQLVDASNEEHLWSENYDRRLDDVFAVQTDIAKRVAKKLEVKLLDREEDRLTRRGVANMAAYKDYLKGRALLRTRDTKELVEAKEYFEKVVKEDPSFAPGFAGLADAFYLLGDYWAMPADEAYHKSREYLNKALKLDPDLAEGRASLALYLMKDYKFVEAESEFKRSIDLNPSYATAHMWYANCLGSLRRYSEEQEQLDIAEELDPLSAVVLYNQVEFLAMRGEKDQALEKMEKRTRLDPSSMSNVDLESFYYSIIGDVERAISLLEKHPEFHNEIPIIVSMAVNLAFAGRVKEARVWLEKILRLPETTAFKDAFIAGVYLGLGDTDKFFESANKAIDKKQLGLANLELFPWFRAAVKDPRWKALLRRVNLDHP